MIPACGWLKWEETTLGYTLSSGLWELPSWQTQKPKGHFYWQESEPRNIKSIYIVNRSRLPLCLGWLGKTLQIIMRRFSVLANFETCQLPAAKSWDEHKHSCGWPGAGKMTAKAASLNFKRKNLNIVLRLFLILPNGQSSCSRQLRYGLAGNS